MNMQERFVLQKTDKNTFRKDSKIGANLRLKKMKSVMRQGGGSRDALWPDGVTGLYISD